MSNIYTNGGETNQFPGTTGGGSGTSLTPAQTTALNEIVTTPPNNLISVTPATNGTDYLLNMNNGSVLTLLNVVGGTATAGVTINNTLTNAQILALTTLNPDVIYVASDNGQTYVVNGTTLIPLVSAVGVDKFVTAGAISGNDIILTFNDSSIVTITNGATGGVTTIVVSANPDNSITVGTDGGAFLNITPLQTSVATNTTGLATVNTWVDNHSNINNTLTDAEILALTSGNWNSQVTYVSTNTSTFYAVANGVMTAISTDKPQQITVQGNGTNLAALLPLNIMSVDDDVRYEFTADFTPITPITTSAGETLTTITRGQKLAVVQTAPGVFAYSVDVPSIVSEHDCLELDLTGVGVNIAGGLFMVAESATGVFTLAQANSLANIGTNVYTVLSQKSGNIFCAARYEGVTEINMVATHGLVAGETYYLSPTVAGGVTTVEPDLITQISMPVIRVISTSRAHIEATPTFTTSLI